MGFRAHVREVSDDRPRVWARWEMVVAVTAEREDEKDEESGEEDCEEESVHSVGFEW